MSLARFCRQKIPTRLGHAEISQNKLNLKSSVDLAIYRSYLCYIPFEQFNICPDVLKNTEYFSCLNLTTFGPTKNVLIFFVIRRQNLARDIGMFVDIGEGGVLLGHYLRKLKLT